MIDIRASKPLAKAIGARRETRRHLECLTRQIMAHAGRQAITVKARSRTRRRFGPRTHHQELVDRLTEGDVVSFEFDQLDELAPFADLEGEVGGLIGPDDIEHAAEALDPNTSAALLIWEDTWAVPLAEALRDSGGVLVEGGRIPHDLVELALGELSAAST